jgi:hypothetical protein
MARTISLPVQFEFNIRRMKWFLAMLNLNSWRRHRNGPWMVEAAVSSPARFKRLRYNLHADDLPDQIRQQLPREGERLPAHLCRIGIEGFLFLPPDYPPQTVKIDPWRAREEFLSLRRSVTDLLVFLNKYGAWKRFSIQDLTPWRYPWRHPRLALAANFWNEQARIREVLRKGGQGWSWGSMMDFRSRPEFPHYLHEDSFCLDAMNTATMVDFLKGVRFRNCARQDCPNVFPADRRGKIYCEQYCGHLVSIRNKRKRASRPKRRPKTGSTTRK